jgi:hypothetical protein
VRPDACFSFLVNENEHGEKLTPIFIFQEIVIFVGVPK